MSKKNAKPSDIRIPPERANEKVDSAVLSELLKSGPPPSDPPKANKPKPKK